MEALYENSHFAGKLVVGVEDKKVTVKDAKFSVGALEIDYLAEKKSFELSMDVSLKNMTDSLKDVLGSGANSKVRGLGVAAWRHGQ